MSMYNTIFGENPLADILLQIIGLSRSDVGRYRDCYFDQERGRIAVYTRNGGGNRSCWCARDSKYGTPRCKHHTLDEEVDDWQEAPESEIPEGAILGNVFTASQSGMIRSYRMPGSKTLKTYYVCENPDSPDCRCVGCFMTYHVHKLPHYLCDRDDDFDSTYATIYFNVPPGTDLELFAKMRPELSGDERWERLFEALRGKP